jgi:hypothetical protein
MNLITQYPASIVDRTTLSPGWGVPLAEFAGWIT